MKEMPVARLFWFLPLLVLLLLGGCGRWSKPGATRLEFAQDRYRCLQGAIVKEVRPEEFGRPRKVQRVDRELFRACMNFRGWELRS